MWLQSRLVLHYQWPAPKSLKLSVKENGQLQAEPREKEPGGWFGTFFSRNIGEFLIIPSDELIFLSGSTTRQEPYFAVSWSLDHLWLVVWNMNFIFPLILGCDYHPNWRTPSFFRGVALAHQPVEFEPFFLRMLVLPGHWDPSGAEILKLRSAANVHEQWQKSPDLYGNPRILGDWWKMDDANPKTMEQIGTVKYPKKIRDLWHSMTTFRHFCGGY